jgi:hypothetical protein
MSKNPVIQRKYSYMHKLRLSVILILSVIAAVTIQSCNKDTVTATAFTTAPFQADIDAVTWAPDSVTTTITYNAAAQTKTFYVIGTKSQKQIIISITVSNNSNTEDFPLGSYVIDGNLVQAQYNTQQLSNGSYVFLPDGTVAPGAGSIDITAINPAKKTITGAFNFYSRTINSDNSVTVHNISSGEFTGFPYTFTSN